jgi:hypothetical protein
MTRTPTGRRVRETHTPEEEQMAQQELDRQFQSDLAMYRREESEMQALKAMDILLPICTFIFFTLTMIPIAGLGYVPMCLFSGFILSHLLHHKILEKIRFRTNRGQMVMPERRFVNQNVRRIVGRGHRHQEMEVITNVD